MKPIATEIESLLKARYPLICLASWEEERVEKMVKQACESTKRVFAPWSPVSGFQGVLKESKSYEPLSALISMAKMDKPAVFLLKDFHPYLVDPKVTRVLREIGSLMEGRSQTIAILSPIPKIPRELEKDVYLLDIPLPEEEEVRGLVAEVADQVVVSLGSAELEKTAKALLGLTEREMRRVLRRAALDGRIKGEVAKFVLAEKRNIIRSSKILELLEPAETLDQVGGLDNLKEWLDSRLLAFSSEARAYGLPEPKGLFLVGVQGCGKSLVSKAIARHWGLPLLRLSTGNLFASFSDEAELELRQVIKITESLAPVVLWIDEIEKGFLDVGQGRSQRGGGAFGSFITWLQEKIKPVFVVATANEIEALPPELVRKGRFDEIFFVDLPNVHERRKIFNIHLTKRRQDLARVDIDSVAKNSEGYSGAEIEQLIISVMYSAFANKKEINTSDFLTLLRQTVPLSVTMEDQIRELKDWAKVHTRPASLDVKRLDMFK